MKSFRKSISKTKPYLYIIPSFVFLAIFTYYPFVNSTYLRFFKYNLSTPDKAFAGLSNYVQILHDPLFWTVVKNNIVYASGTNVVSVSLGMIFAIVVHENIKRKGILSGCHLLSQRNTHGRRGNGLGVAFHTWIRVDQLLHSSTGFPRYQVTRGSPICAGCPDGGGDMEACGLLYDRFHGGASKHPPGDIRCRGHGGALRHEQDVPLRCGNGNRYQTRTTPPAGGILTRGYEEQC